MFKNLLLILTLALFMGQATMTHGLPKDSTLINSILLKIRLSEETKDTDIKQAMQYAKEALTTAQQIGNQRMIGESKLQLGKCYDFLGGNIEALNHLLGALEIFTTLNNRVKVAQANKLIGYTYYLSNEYLTALDYFNNVYKCGINLHDTLLTIEGLIGKGSVYGNINKMDSALIIFNESFELAKRIGSKHNEVQSLFYMGDVNLYSGREQEAINTFLGVEKNYDLEKINPRMISALYNSMTKAYIETGNVKMAKAYSQKTKEALKVLPRLDRNAFYYLLKFQIDTAEKNYSNAIESYANYKTLNDSLRNSYFKEKIKNTETLYQLEKRDREIDKLMTDGKIKDIVLKQRRFINYVSILIIVLLIIIVYQIAQASIKIKAKNRLLQEQREELATTNEELLSINEELHKQREELEVVLGNLQSTQKQLIQSEKMASLGVLASGVAHEINNPLNFIKGGSIGIREYIRSNLKEHIKELYPFLESIDIGIDRAVTIITSLNHYSRQDDTKKVDCQIDSIIENCLVMLHNRIKNRITIEKDFSKTKVKVVGNEGKLHQVFLNILINAIHAIENTGTISISSKLEGDYIQLYFKDTGKGIDQENLTKILDPFFTTKEPGQGVGLGLPIVQTIINDHNGTIDFDSKMGVGTKVTITLPVKQRKGEGGKD